MPIQHWSEKIWVVQLGDEPALSEDLIQVKDEAAQALKPPHFVLDLSAVSYLNSTNLSQILRLRKFAIDHQVKLVLARPNDSIWAVFLTTGLDKVLEFASDVSTALAGMQIDP